MKCKTPAHPLTAGLVAGLILAGASGAFGGPVRPITSGQFIQQAPAPNGAPRDPLAQRGQWFVNVTNASESANQWDWTARDAGPCLLQYCDNLASNFWMPVSVNPPLPPIIPGLCRSASALLRAAFGFEEAARCAGC